MSGVLPAFLAGRASWDQCGPSTGGSSLFGFLFTSSVCIASWAVSVNAHNSKVANESHFIISFFLLVRLERSRAPPIVLWAVPACQSVNRRRDQGSGADLSYNLLTRLVRLR